MKAPVHAWPWFVLTTATVTLVSCHTPAPVAANQFVGGPAGTRVAVKAAGSSERPKVDIEAKSPVGIVGISLAPSRAALGTATITDLDPGATQALLARLEPLPDLTAASAATPSIRPKSTPPPRQGTPVPIAFEAPTGKAVDDRPVQLRTAPKPLVAPSIAPTGEVAVETTVRVRFSEPMVPIAAVGEAKTVPAEISPPVPGTWRWLDTRVLVFEAKDKRLPQATDFTVRVPANIKALSGAELHDVVTETFSTPPVRVVSAYPSHGVRPDSAVAVRFDQDIDPDAVASKVAIVDAKTRKPLAMHRIALDEARQLWARNPSLAGDKLQDAIGEHYIVFAPDKAWPAATSLDVELAAGTPSREGNRVSKDKSFARFDVVGPFKLLGIACDDLYEAALAGRRCSALSFLSVVMSNTIDRSTYHADRVQIVGRRFADNYLSQARINVEVPPDVGSSFNIAVSDGLFDIYGQPEQGSRTSSFTVIPERWYASLNAPSGLLVLDPRFAIPQWIVEVSAVDKLGVELYRVEPKDYFAYEAFEAGTRKTPPGTRVSEQSFPIGKSTGAIARIDLRPALSSTSTGHVVAVARAKDHMVTAWLQVTTLGVVARVDGDKVNAWVNDITPRSFRSPVAGVTTSMIVERDATKATPVTTDADGHAAMELPAPPPMPTDPNLYPKALLVASHGTDSTFAAMSSYEHAVRQEELRWYVTDDRFMYKPGETVSVKGWIRRTDTGVNPSLTLLGEGEPVAYMLRDSVGNQIAQGTAKLTDQGGFDLAVTLPGTPNLGTATFTFSTHGHSYSHPIAVQEFRTPAYAVMLDDDVTHAGATPLVLGESIEMSAEARYYAGGGLAGAQLAWDAQLQAASFRPAGWDLFTFDPPAREGAGRASEHRDTQLSGASTATAVFSLASLPQHHPSLLTVDATVADVDREHIRASSRAILVHPASYYVGLRQTPAGELVAIVTDIDGHTVRGVPISIVLVGTPWSERYRKDAAQLDTQTCNLTSADAPVPCAWRSKNVDFSYVATASVTDPRGRENAAAFAIPGWRQSDGNGLAVVADRASYRPGDVAKLDVRSKTFPATAIVTIARGGVVSQKKIEITSASTKVELPIDATMLEDIYVQVDRISDREVKQSGSTGPLPEMASAEAHLSVDLDSARLVMTARASAPLVEPGSPATFTVEVRHDDKPLANAEVALMVVDEAVLALSGKSHPDPLPSFYRNVAAGTWEMSTFDMVFDEGNRLAGEPGIERFELGISGMGMGGGGTGYGSIGAGRYGTIGHGSGTGSVVVSRKDFRATAAFAPVMHTDEQGRATLTVTMPDSLTRFRVVALAASGPYYFGKAESTIVTQRKINARTVAPRFLTQGDRFALPVVVQNLDTVERQIDVAVRGGNLAATGGQGKHVVLPAGQRTEVRFDFASQALGRAVVQTIVVAGEQADASNVELPVYAPATTESFATYGVVDKDTQFEQLAVPADLFRDVGGVEVELSSTQMQSLTDAYWYLYAYPYECAEQRSARMIATNAMYDILEAFGTPGRPTKQDIAAQRDRDIDKLVKDQQSDGGWGYWRDMKADPYVTMQVLTAIGRQAIPGPTIQRAVKYVLARADELQATLDKAASLPPERRLDRASFPYQVSLEAASLTALAAVGVDVKARATKLHAAATALGAYPIDAKARVLAVVAGDASRAEMRKKLLSDLLAVTEETASSATVTVSFVESERALLVSNTKTSALALDAMIREKPDLALITKLARGVLDGRRHGRWTSTQENLTALTALRRYFDAFEKTTPDFTGKVWVGTAAYTEQAFVGHTNDRGLAHLDWTALAPGSTNDLTIAKDGPGRMYYRVGITYAPKKMDLPALDAGFIVRRTYTAIDDPSDVVKRADGTTHVRLGARVLVTIEAINSTKRYGVALVDPMPAGFEAVNEALATSERAVAAPLDDRWDHRATRDDRTEAFSMALNEGSHQMSYMVRAATPGTFLAAPAKAEEMYSPETFGRSTGGQVVIE